MLVYSSHISICLNQVNPLQLKNIVVYVRFIINQLQGGHVETNIIFLKEKLICSKFSIWEQIKKEKNFSIWVFIEFVALGRIMISIV